MLWNWSFFMSVFAIISAAPTRLLEHLPGKGRKHYKDEDIRVALGLFLQDSKRPDNLEDKREDRRVSKKMLWVWQCPTMLMSYSWVFFLVGYALHVLTPIFDVSQANVSAKVR
jgi:hypothetical protein